MPPLCLPITPVSDSAVAKQVAITGMNDNKRQITVTVVCTASGHLLSPQLLFVKALLVAVILRLNLPLSESLAGPRNIPLSRLVPYVNRVRQELGLPETQKTLLVVNVLKANRSPDVLDRFKEAGLVYFSR